MRRSVRLGLCAAALVLAACPGRRPASPETIARFAERDLTNASLQSYLAKNTGGSSSDLDSAVLSGLLDQFLEEQLLLTLAQERGLLAPGTSANARSSVHRLLAADLEEPSDAAIASYFEAHSDEFSRPERVRVAQILADSRERAEEARKALLAGSPVGEVAARYSVAPASANPTELARNELPPELADRIFALRAGETSEAITADYGFHVFQVVDRLPPTRLSLREAEPEVRRRLLDATQLAHFERLLDEARNRYNLEIYEQNLPFDYQGRFLAPGR
jgi:hypothetical protein